MTLTKHNANGKQHLVIQSNLRLICQINFLFYNYFITKKEIKVTHSNVTCILLPSHYNGNNHITEPGYLVNHFLDTISELH